MANIIKAKRSAVPGKVPATTDLALGEIGINTYDGKAYIKKDVGGVESIVALGGAGSGDVTGPAVAADNAITRFDGASGKIIQNSSVTLDDNGNFGNVNAISLDTTPGTLPTAAGSMFWDSGNGTPSIILTPDVTLQLGQEQLALVYNGTGSTIQNGKVVAVTGAQGQRPSVALADADSEALSAPTLGIATQDIANGAEGFVTTFGFVRGLDTSAFTAGDPLYLSQTAGGFTATRPSAPAHTVALGWVIKVNASSGEIFVNINNGWELDELHNVLISGLANNDALIYDSSAGVWKNTPLKTLNSSSIIGSGNVSVGDVFGPASATDDAIARFDTTTGKLIQNSGATIDDSGNLTATTNSATGTGANKMPVGTTAQRPVTPASGMYRLNSSLNVPEWYDAESSSWLPFNVGKQYAAELLIIAGGGAGGGGGTGSLRTGSGGGAGGLIDFVSTALDVGVSYAITVGAGGAGATLENGTSGGNSSVVFGSLSLGTAIGGGGGLVSGAGAGVSGGSGGGGGSAPGTSAGGAGTSGQGNAGGSGYGSSPYRGGGGGGKGGAGGTGLSGPTGGSSINTSYSGSTIAYCGGGGGGGHSGASAGAGGGAGAGAGGDSANGGNASTANRGSGGGGGGGSANTRGGNGASGRVVIRYLGSQRGTGGTVTSSGGYTIHTFDSSGTYVA